MESGVRLHRYGEFTKYLASRGHDVTWWTSTFSHAPKKNYFDRDFDTKLDGVKVKFIFGKGYKRNVSLARMRHQKQFSKSFFKYARDSIRNGDVPDLIVSPVPTIEAAYETAKISLEYGIPYLVDIRDYWPDDLTNIAPFPLRPIAKIILGSLYKKMDYVCRNASSIMGNSKVSVEYGLKYSGRSQSPLDLIFPLGYRKENYSDKELIKERAWFKKLNLRQNFIKVCFFGTIGRFFDFDLVIEAANLLEKKYNVEFLICGRGEKLSYYEKKTKKKKISSIKFLGFLTKKEMNVVMENSQIGLAPYVTHHEFALPNKIFEYMSGKLAILSSIQKELPEIIQSNHCGLTYDGSLDEFLIKLGKLLKDRGLREEMGKNAYRLFLEKYQMEKVFKRAENHFENILYGN